MSTKIEKGQQQLDKKDIEKTADALGLTPEILQYGKIIAPKTNDAATAAKKITTYKTERITI